jgi:hypothetical protein
VNSGTKECSHSSFVFFLYLLVSYYSIIWYCTRTSISLYLLL